MRSVHLPLVKKLADQFEVVGFCARHIENAQKIAAETGLGKGFTDVREMKKAHPDLDVVTVATMPNTTHAPLAIEALEAGCHVFVDKPFACSLKEAKDVFAVARKHNRRAVAFQNRRFETSFIAFRDVVEKGFVGKLKVFKNFVSCKSQSRSMLDLGAHIIDQAICLTHGETPLEVSAILQNPEKNLTDEQAMGYFKINLRYPNDLLVEIEQLPMGKHVNYFYVAGTKGGFQMDWADGISDLFYKQMDVQVDPPIPAHEFMPSSSELVPPELFANWGREYHRSYAGLYKHLVDNASPPVSERETLIQLAIMEYAIKSARTGKTLAFDLK